MTNWVLIQWKVGNQRTAHPDVIPAQKVPPARSEPMLQMPPSGDGTDSGPRIWRAGTLVYTFGGLVGLFALLLLGDFAWAMRERSVAPMAQWYLNSLKIPSVYFGLFLSSFPALIGLIFCPIISVKSDRYRSRWGRRIPFCS